jgi:hypothetical protein
MGTLHPHYAYIETRFRETVLSLTLPSDGAMAAAQTAAEEDARRQKAEVDLTVLHARGTRRIRRKHDDFQADLGGGRRQMQRYYAEGLLTKIPT